MTGSDPSAAQASPNHTGDWESASLLVHILGWFFVASGLFSAFSAVAGLVMVGLMPPLPEPEELGPMATLFTGSGFAWMLRHLPLLCALQAAGGIAFVVGGAGLLRRRDWARRLLEALCWLSLVGSLLYSVWFGWVWWHALGTGTASPTGAEFVAAMRGFGVVAALGNALIYGAIFGFLIWVLRLPAVRGWVGELTPPQPHREEPARPLLVTVLGWGFAVLSVLSIVGTLLGAAAMALLAPAMRAQLEATGGELGLSGLLVVAYAALIVVHLAASVVSLWASREFLRLREWARRWFEVLAWTGAASLVLFTLLLVCLWVVTAVMVGVDSENSLQSWGVTVVGLLVTFFSGLVYAAPCVALIWLLRKPNLRAAFLPSRRAPETRRSVE